MHDHLLLAVAVYERALVTVTLFLPFFYCLLVLCNILIFFFFSDPATTVSYTLSLHDALPILDLEAEDGNIKYGVLDSSLWHKRGDTGPSLAEQMIMKGCRWRPSDRSRGSRVAGKNEIHRRLQIDEFTEEPRLVFFNSCTNVISQIPSIPLDKKNPEDVDTKSEEHLYDELRYGIMSRPRCSIFDYDRHGRPSTGMPVADSTFGY